MPNLDVLKQRVEDAERRLHSVQSARERECDALMEMWHQIRGKFQDQAQEIADYRTKLTALQDMNVELAAMIDSMLGSIEGSVERSFDQAVPEITGMAKELLETEPAADADLTDISLDNLEDSPSIASTPTPATSIPTSAEGQLLSQRLEELGQQMIDQHREPEAIESEPSDGPAEPTIATPAIPDDPDEVLELTEPASHEEPSSVGIRNLIGRIERAVNRSSGQGDQATGENEVDRELEEIEHLRSELNGLRARISSSGPAE